MSTNSDPGNVSRRQFLAAAGTIATASPFAVGKDSDSAHAMPPTTPVDYTITVNVKNKPLTYCAKDGHGNCVPMPNKDLKVNPGDSIKWDVDNDSGHYTVTIGFFKTQTTPLADNNGPLYSVSGTDSPTQKGSIAKTASGPYAYFVRVNDGNGPHPDDPRIIVGKFGTSEKLADATAQLREVRAKIAAIEEELSEAKPELRK